MTPWQAEHCTLKQAMPRDFSGTAGLPARNAIGAETDRRTACARLSHALEHGLYILVLILVAILVDFSTKIKTKIGTKMGSLYPCLDPCHHPWRSPDKDKDKDSDKDTVFGPTRKHPASPLPPAGWNCNCEQLSVFRRITEFWTAQRRKAPPHSHTSPTQHHASRISHPVSPTSHPASRIHTYHPTPIT